MCPFCPILLPDQPDQYRSLEDTFFGDVATIDGIPSCEPCAIVAEMTETGQILAQQIQQQKGSSKKEAELEQWEE